MKRITLMQVQRESGLPLAACVAIFNEQLALARRRYRCWSVLAWFVFATACACNFAPAGTLAYRVGSIALVLAIIGLGSVEGLMQRRVQTRFLAAALAAAHAG